jgi:DNA-directed RNA polymerase subunit RPC12/RpoP
MERSVCTVKITCSKCGKTYEFPVFVDDLEKYTKRQEHIQYALPYISPEYRELIISHICPTCWDEIMERDEEEY